MRTATLLLLLLMTTGCTPKPTETVLADSVFSAQALLDANGNGKIDPEDTPIENATFSVELGGVKVFSDITDETGNAFLLIPGGVEYPVNVIMEAPGDSTLTSITPSKITVSASSGDLQFLFSSK
jgi:hypothetical protein